MLMGNQHVEVDEGDIRFIEIAATSSRSPVRQGELTPGVAVWGARWNLRGARKEHLELQMADGAGERARHSFNDLNALDNLTTDLWERLCL